MRCLLSNKRASVRHSHKSGTERRSLIKVSKNFPASSCAARLNIYLLVIIFSFSCAPKAYKELSQTEGSAECLQKFQPKFQRVLYRTAVDVTGNHLSGILLIKEMPDSSIRLLFTNEAGFKFFDFEFSKTGGFKVYSIIDKMDKAAVKQTLRKDFQLILFNKPAGLLRKYDFRNRDANETYFGYNEGEDHYYYITDLNCTMLMRMERGSSTRKVLEAFSEGIEEGVPDSVRIHHTNFNFDINLKRIYEDAQ